VEYETKVFQHGFGNETTKYQGWPNDDIDREWEEMYSSKFTPSTWFGLCLSITEGVTLHVDSKMHDQIAAKSEHIPIPGFEGEYMIGLDVFHQLHCLVSRSRSDK
jgi:hypothetical protein